MGETQMSHKQDKSVSKVGNTNLQCRDGFSILKYTSHHLHWTTAAVIGGVCVYHSNGYRSINRCQCQQVPRSTGCGLATMPYKAKLSFTVNSRREGNKTKDSHINCRDWKQKAFSNSMPYESRNNKLACRLSRVHDHLFTCSECIPQVSNEFQHASNSSHKYPNA